MSSIQTVLDKIVRNSFPGAFVFIEDANGAIQFYTSGHADLELQRRMKPDMPYRAGSTTKTFTAVVILQLIQEGKLQLYDTLDLLLPDLTIPNGDRLNVEHLLRMRSGLFDFENDPDLKDNLEAHLRAYNLKDTVQMGIRHPAAFEPDEKFGYCNTNFCLLEMIIERISGRSLGEEMRQRIFHPLGLVNTQYPDWDDLSLPQPYIHGYERSPDGWSDHSEIFFGRGDGALVSTALDLARFFKALLLERSLLTESMIEQMTAITVDEPPAERDYGLGLIASPVSCGKVWGHSGGGYGYVHLPFLHLETGRFAIFMVNGTAHSAEKENKRLNFESAFEQLRDEIYCG